MLHRILMLFHKLAYQASMISTEQHMLYRTKKYGKKEEKKTKSMLKNLMTHHCYDPIM